MDWITKLERKLGRFAIPNLMLYIIILYGVGFVLSYMSPGFYENYLALNAGAILRGQVWRIVTFLIQPPDGSVILIAFVLYLYYMIGNSLEAAWGAFRFNLYFFSGVLFHVIAVILVYLIFHGNLQVDTSYLNLSLFFAFAALYPNTQFLLLFVIPVKVKYLAWINAAFFAYTILQAFLPAYGGVYYQARALAAVVSILNFLLFYFSSRNFKAHAPSQVRRKMKFQNDMKQARVKYEKRENGGAIHRCAVCGRTELDDPNLEFRFCSKCKGDFEYCQDHLFTHEHKSGRGKL
ncbi:MAG: rhomboid family intramembrane serine protease [Lachnospiraceae bacterium]